MSSRRTARTGRGGKSGKKASASAAAKKTARAEALADYRSKRKAVQPYVSFRIPTTRHPSSAVKLQKYFNYLFGEYGAARGVRVPVKRKDPKKLAKLKERFGQGPTQGGLPGVKYVFVPTVHKRDSDQLVRPIIRHRKKGPDVIVFREQQIDDDGDKQTLWEVSTQFMPFDKDAMLNDIEAEVRRVGQALMDSMGIDDPRQALFRIQNGGHQMKAMLSLDRMVGEVQFRIARYSPGGLQKDENPWDEWLDGLTIETSGMQNGLRQYANARELDRSRRKKVGEINIQWSNLLRSIETSKGGAHTERLAVITNGTADDAPNLRKVLGAMRTKGLVNGDDNRWMMTRQGIDYLSNTRSLLPLFNL